MAVLDLSRLTSKTNNTSNRTEAQQRPAAQLWLNIGVIVKGAGEDGSDLFLSLPQGIPLDTIEKLSTRSSNEDFRDRQAARNDLLDQLLSLGESMQPGEERFIGGDEDGLVIQVRRVREETAPTDADKNKFAVKLNLGDK